MNPYYVDGHVVLYHADCREILPSLSDLMSSGCLVLTDPPYGISQDEVTGGDRSALTRSNRPVKIEGDDEPFDPTHLLAFARLVLWGANYYADKLPPGGSWIVWDKLDGLEGKREIGFNDNGDAELAWTNLGGPTRLLRHRWTGMLKASERCEPRLHPAQKPVVLLEQIIAWRSRATDAVIDPYAGAGSTLLAAKLQGRKAIGIEIEEHYCEVTARRLSQGVLDLV